MVGKDEMHVFCFFKTPLLKQEFQTYFQKALPFLTFSCLETRSFPPSFLFLEEPTLQELKLYRSYPGICLWKKAIPLPQEDTYPSFVFFQKPLYLPDLLTVFLEKFHALKISSEASDSHALKIGPFLFKKSERSLQHFSSKRSLSLTEKETDILDFLSSRPQGYASRTELLTNIWHLRDNISTRTLESHIYTLRKKIEENPTFPCYLLTEPGGYRLNYESTVTLS